MGIYNMQSKPAIVKSRLQEFTVTEYGDGLKARQHFAKCARKKKPHVEVEQCGYRCEVFLDMVSTPWGLPPEWQQKVRELLEEAKMDRHDSFVRAAL